MHVVTSTPAANGKLTWGLVICTYKRERILPRALRLALTQTRPPVEMIVIDASPDWDKTRDVVLKECAGVLPARWFYEKAERQSITVQRNQGLRLATVDIVFMIDDDSLLYPDCAEHVMRIYEADTASVVAGVCPIRMDGAPDEPATVERPEEAVVHKKWWVALGERLYELAGRFIPYDGRYPHYELPPEVIKLGVERQELFIGFKMTFRRAAAVKEWWADVLEGYSAAEDLDASYRISRHGALVQSLNARLCHLSAPGGRISRFTRSALFCLNIGVLMALYSPNANRARWQYRRMLIQRMIVEFLNDVVRKRWTLPQPRGVLLAWRNLPAIFAKTPAELKSWYPGYQRALLERDGQRG